MRIFSNAWKGSKKPGKQRKYRTGAPFHTKQRMLKANLSKPLRKKHNFRSFRLKVGDKVKVLRGNFSGKEGTIKQIDLTKLKVSINGIEITKNDGTKVFPFIDPSNLQITELKLEDKRRQKIMSRKNG